MSSFQVLNGPLDIEHICCKENQSDFLSVLINGLLYQRGGRFSFFFFFNFNGSIQTEGHSNQTFFPLASLLYIILVCLSRFTTREKTKTNRVYFPSILFKISMDFHIIEIKMKMCVNRTLIVFEDSKQNAAKTTTKRKKKKTKQKKTRNCF